MTMCNYTGASNHELLDEVRLVRTSMNHLGRKVRAVNPDLFSEIVSRTSFLEDGDIQFTARLHCLEHNIVEQPTCKMCGNPVGWHGKVNSFRTYCSRNCQYSDDDFWRGVHDTCERRYGARNVFCSETIKDRIRNTNIERLGVDYPMQSPEVRGKSKMTCMDNLGVENPSQAESVKRRKEETSYMHYGVHHPYLNPDVRAKAVATCIERWGVDNFSKSPLFNASHRKRVLHDGIWFDSTWEVKVYEFCRDNGIPVEYSPEISYEYAYGGKTHTYHPDFLIDGKIYEVKGDHFFRINESTGEEEMFCPYREPDWSDAYYEWKCGQFEAKHQCMLANGVTILRESDVEGLSRSAFV